MTSRSIVSLFVVFAFCGAARAQTTLHFPRLVTTNGTTANPDNSEYTGFAIANLDSVAATLTLTAYTGTGAVMSGAGVTNPATRVLNPGEQLALVDTQIFGAGLASLGQTGWVEVSSTATKVVGFFLMFNGSLNFLDGSDVSDKRATSFIFPEVSDLGYTEIWLANPSGQSTSVTYTLYRSDGAFIAADIIFGVQSKGRDRSRSSVPKRTSDDMFPGVRTQPTDHIRVTTTADVVPFQHFGVAGQFVAGLRGQDLASSATTLYAPQYVVGGSDWRSTLSIVNADMTAGTVTLKFFKDDGTQVGSTREMPIAGRGKIYVSDQAFFANVGATLTQGYVEITSSGPKLTGCVVFGDQQRSKFAAALPFASTLEKSVVFGQVASDETYFTGVAMLNTSGAAVNATIDVYDGTGKFVVTKTETIGARQRKSQLLTQFFPSLVGEIQRSGYIRVTADAPVASFALFGTNDLSVLSAIPPQIVP